MAMAKNKTLCFTCNKEKITYPCKGCSKEFCLVDLTQHRQILTKELLHITFEYNKLKQTIHEQTQNPQNDLLIKQINQWEIKSIEKIQQKAQEYREILIKSSQTCLSNIEMKFNDLTEQIKHFQKETDLNEINLNHLRNQLMKIRQELNNPSKITVKEDLRSFFNESLIISTKKPTFNKWKQNAMIVAGGNGEGEGVKQLFYPEGIFIDEKKNIFIADYWNHRIVEWKHNAKQGQIVAGGNGKGNQMDQLNYPTHVIVDQQNHSIIIADSLNRRVIQWLNQNQQILIDDINCSRLAMDQHGYLYVSDWKKNEVRRWKMGKYNNEGIVVAGGNEQGNELNQLDFPKFIFVDEYQSVYVSDQNNHRVIKWRKDAKKGTVVAGGNGQGRNLNQLSQPEGVFVDDLGRIYVADCVNDRVMRWCEEKKEGEIVVGENDQRDQLCGPCGLSFDDEGNLYIADCDNYEIKKFEIIL
ncbi:unnamed protein product [Adineta steineri]|uniref:Uncharacterized protein n=1 Tax=Adineta steineri TaxID=433720 RepID=A0A815N3Q6_9BILA|nr:unnamed protein product [Adineta steineri]CAF1625288.1 unnamed protein product [Adineta steineri]